MIDWYNNCSELADDIISTGVTRVTKQCLLMMEELLPMYGMMRDLTTYIDSADVRLVLNAGKHKIKLAAGAG